MVFADLWHYTPADVYAMTRRQFTLFRDVADERVKEAQRQSRKR